MAGGSWPAVRGRGDRPLGLARGHLLCPDGVPSPSLSPYSHDEGCLSSSQDHAPLAALPLLATSSPQYQEAIATVIQRANLAYGDFIRSQEGVTFNGQVSRGVGRWKTENSAGRAGLDLQPSWGRGRWPSPAASQLRPRAAPRPPPLQVCLIGDCVGGILAFDALCCSNQPVSESQSSSRRGSVASVQVPAPAAPPGVKRGGQRSPGLVPGGQGSAWAADGYSR